MTIAFPRDFPTSDFSNCDFNLVRGDAVARSYAGQIQAIELADPYWTMKATTQPLTPALRAKWKAWAASLKGSINQFYAFDIERLYPINYGASALTLTRAGGGTFDGTASLDAATATTLSISGLSNAYALAAGDHVSIGLEGGQRSLHVVTEDDTALVDGTVTVNVEPPVPASFDLLAAVQLVAPKCIMVMKPNSFNAPADGTGLAPVSFEAVQVLV